MSSTHSIVLQDVTKEYRRDEFRIPVLIDGGVRRGTDVLKAIALGAAAVGIGRPYVWGLASFGEAGVDRVLQILDDEFITIMRQAGAVNISQIMRDHVTRA